MQLSRVISISNRFDIDSESGLLFICTINCKSIQVGIYQEKHKQKLEIADVLLLFAAFCIFKCAAEESR